MGNGDARSASISKRIAEEEVGHVAVGVAWFVDVCHRLGMDPAGRFQGIYFTPIFLVSFSLLNKVGVCTIVLLFYSTIISITQPDF